LGTNAVDMRYAAGAAAARQISVKMIYFSAWFVVLPSLYTGWT